MQEHIESNRRHWDELVDIHVRSSFYDVASFKAGRSTLMPVERRELGDVRGKTLMHLQCHFGMDTLSWAREGAIVTGVDFSPEAIRVAGELSRELGIEARFVESDIYQLPDVLEGVFDIVFASYGVICWLPDFPRWAQIAASYVKPGGIFYLIDDHPLAAALADDSTADSMRLELRYLSQDPIISDEDGSYADSTAKLQNRRTVEFAHGLGEMVTALVDAGLQIEFLHEFPEGFWPRLPQMQRRDDSLYELPDNQLQMPFMFSLRGRKPA